VGENGWEEVEKGRRERKKGIWFQPDRANTS